MGDVVRHPSAWPTPRPARSRPVHLGDEEDACDCARCVDGERALDPPPPASLADIDLARDHVPALPGRRHNSGGSTRVRAPAFEKHLGMLAYHGLNALFAAACLFGDVLLWLLTLKSRIHTRKVGRPDALDSS